MSPGARLLARLLTPLALLPATGTPALAAEPSWPKATYEYVVVDEDLRAVLQQFGANTGIRIALSDKVQGHVHGRLQSAPPRAFLSNLAKEFGLDWYYDGATLSISAASETTTKLLALRGVSLEGLITSLAAADLLDPRFPLRRGPGTGMAVVSGPPRYIAIVDQVLDALVAGVAHPAGRMPPAKRVVTIMRGVAVNRVEFP